MATPLAPPTALAALRAEGLRIVELPGWATHNRNAVGAWGGVHGVMIHHTGSDVSAANARTYAGFLYGGRSDLPGPLCQSGLSVDGTVYMTGWGRANHAGGGDPAVLAAVINEDPLPRTTKGNTSPGRADGNASFYGLEVIYSGYHPMAAVQRAAAVRWAAALCRAHGWSAKSVIGHGEWSSDKWDPGNESMDAFRRDVQALLDLPAGASTAAPTAPKPAPPIIPAGAPHMYRVIFITDGKGGYAKGLLNGDTGKVAAIPNTDAERAVSRVLSAMEGKVATSSASALSFAELNLSKPVFEGTSATVFTKESK